MLRLAFACAAVWVGVVGCSGPAHGPTTRLALDEDTATAEPAFWLGQPAEFAASHAEFQPLWDASEQVLRRWLFTVDRRDFREGLLVTRPLVSRQWFEFWRPDTGTARGVAENSLATIRRTVYCSLERSDDGFTARPRVLMEKLAFPGKGMIDPEIPARYWYAIGRDTEMERKLVQAIQQTVSNRRQEASRR